MTRTTAREGRPSSAGTQTHRTDDPRRDAELAAAHDLAGWNPDPIIVAFEEDEIVPENFTNPAFRMLAETVITMITNGVPPTPTLIRDHLVAAGLSGEDAAELVLVPGGFEAAGYRLDGVRFHLHQLAEHVERERLERQLVSLHDTLSRPGGPARVAAALGVVM